MADLKTPLVLNAYYFDDEDIATSKLTGVEIPFENWTTRERMFFSVDSVGSYDLDNGKYKGILYSGGDSFVVDMNPKELSYRILECLKLEGISPGLWALSDPSKA